MQTEKPKKPIDIIIWKVVTWVICGVLGLVLIISIANTPKTEIDIIHSVHDFGVFGIIIGILLIVIGAVCRANQSRKEMVNKIYTYGAVFSIVGAVVVYSFKSDKKELNNIGESTPFSSSSSETSNKPLIDYTGRRCAECNKKLIQGRELCSSGDGMSGYKPFCLCDNPDCWDIRMEKDKRYEKNRRQFPPTETDPKLNDFLENLSK